MRSRVTSSGASVDSTVPATLDAAYAAAAISIVTLVLSVVAVILVRHSNLNRRFPLLSWLALVPVAGPAIVFAFLCVHQRERYAGDQPHDSSSSRRWPPRAVLAWLLSVPAVFTAFTVGAGAIDLSSWNMRVPLPAIGYLALGVVALSLLLASLFAPVGRVFWAIAVVNAIGGVALYPVLLLAYIYLGVESVALLVLELSALAAAVLAARHARTLGELHPR